jgi:hypothetical protein
VRKPTSQSVDVLTPRERRTRQKQKPRRSGVEGATEGETLEIGLSGDAFFPCVPPADQLP